MQAKITTLSAALCGLTALSLAGCEAHALTARLTSASPPSAAPPADPGLYSHQPTTESQATYTARGCEEPGGCYYGVRLVGYPVEEAKRRAIAFGYQGQIDVFERGGPSCAAGTVCEVEPANWPAFGQTMTLYVNYVKRELTISKPQ